MKGHSMCVCVLLNIQFSNNDSLFFETILLWTRSSVWDQSCVTHIPQSFNWWTNILILYWSFHLYFYFIEFIFPSIIISWPGPDAAKQPKLCCLLHHTLQLGWRCHDYLQCPFQARCWGCIFFRKIFQSTKHWTLLEVGTLQEPVLALGLLVMSPLHLPVLLCMTLPRPATKNKIHNKRLRESVRPHNRSWTMGEVAMVETCTNGPVPIKLPRGSCSGNMTSVLFHKLQVSNKVLFNRQWLCSWYRVWDNLLVQCVTETSKQRC